MPVSNPFNDIATEFKEMGRKLDELNAKIDAIKIPDPTEEKLFKAKDWDSHFNVSRSKGQDMRKKAIERGLIRPVEISAGVYRYRRSEILAINYNDMK